MLFGLISRKDRKSFQIVSGSTSGIVRNLVANLTSEYIYENQTSSSQEAIFEFPIEGSCVVHGFEAHFKNKKVKGVCKDKTEANNIYQSAKEKGIDVAMGRREMESRDVFTCHIGQVKSGEEVKVLVEYSFQLTKSLVNPENSNAERFNLDIPLVSNPRYRSQGPIYKERDAHIQNDYMYSMNIKFTGDRTIFDVKSNHNLNIKYLNKNKMSAEVILLSKLICRMDMEISVEYSRLIGPSVFYDRGGENDAKSAFFTPDVAIVNFMPQQLLDTPSSDIDEENSCKYEIVFMVDRSGSMYGSNINQAKECLLIFLKSLPTNCKFQIYGFGSHFDKAFDTPQLYDEKSLGIALKYQQLIDADFGGTEIFPPLKDLYNIAIYPDYSRILFLLTDGDVYDQEKVFHLVRTNSSNTRVFTVGIGQGASTSLVKGIAEAGNGECVYTRDSNSVASDIRPKVMGLLNSSLQTNFVRDVQATFHKTDDIQIMSVPTTIPNIYLNQNSVLSLMIFGLTEKNPSIICKLKGVLHLTDEQFEYEIPINRPINQSNLDQKYRYTGHHLLASLRANELENEIVNLTTNPDATKNVEEIKKELIKLSVEANIVTDLTSFIAVSEDETKKETDYLVESITPIKEAGFDTIDFREDLYCMNNSDEDIEEDDMMCVMEESQRFSLSSHANAYDAVDMPDMVCCSPSNDIQPMVQEEEFEEDFILLVARSQTFDGFWRLNEIFLHRMGMDLDKFKATNPGLTDDAWMSVLLCSYFKCKLDDVEITWRLLRKKTMLWLKKQLGQKLLDEVLLKSQNVIDSL